MENKLLQRWWGNHFVDPPLRWQLQSLEMMRRWCNSFRVLPLTLFDDNNDYDEVMIVMMWWCWWGNDATLFVFCHFLRSASDGLWFLSEVWEPTHRSDEELLILNVDLQQLWVVVSAKQKTRWIAWILGLGGYKGGFSRREQWRWWKTYRV